MIFMAGITSGPNTAYGAEDAASLIDQAECFESDEHFELGTQGFAAAGVDKPITVENVMAPAGLFTALQGDFYGPNWKELQLDCKDNPEGIKKLLAIIEKEGADRHAGGDPNTDGAVVIATHGMHAQFLNYAKQNYTHFSERTAQSDESFDTSAHDNPAYAEEISHVHEFGANAAEWLRLHMIAAKTAMGAARQKKPIDLSFAQDAGACHFLTDAFSSGHKRTPRRHMVEEYNASFRGAVDQLAGDIVNVLPDAIDPMRDIGLGQLEGKMPEGMRPTISLASVKQFTAGAIKRPLEAYAGWLAKTAGDWGAKTLHDKDNKDGLNVHNQLASWHATGDGHMSESATNEKMAVQAVAASVEHIKTVYALSQSGGQGDDLPFISLRPIFNLLPVLDEDKNESQEEWRPGKASAAFSAEVTEKLLSTSADFVESMADAVMGAILQAVRQAIEAAAVKLGRAGHWVNEHIDKLVDWVVSKLPKIDARYLAYRMMGMQIG